MLQTLNDAAPIQNLSSGEFNQGRNVNRASSFFMFEKGEKKESLESYPSQVEVELPLPNSHDNVPESTSPLFTLLYNIAISSYFKKAMQVIVFLHIICSLIELTLALLVGLFDDSDTITTIIHFPIVFNAIILISFFISIAISLYCSLKQDIDTKAKMYSLFDLFIVFTSACLELTGLFHIDFILYTSLISLIFRIFTSFRIVGLLNRKMIEREDAIISQIKRYLELVRLDYEESGRENREIRREIAHYQTLICYNNNELNEISENLIQVKRKSWSNLVPLTTATNISSSRRNSYSSINNESIKNFADSIKSNTLYTPNDDKNQNKKSGNNPYAFPSASQSKNSIMSDSSFTPARQASRGSNLASSRLPSNSVASITTIDSNSVISSKYTSSISSRNN